MSRVIDAAALRARLGEDGLVIVDTRGGDDWRAATIPGAVQLNVYDYFIPTSDLAGIADMERAVAAAFVAVGIDKAKTVVFFEKQTGMVSPRGLWFHEFAGHAGGLVLDGGFDAWLAAGGPAAPGEGLSASISSDPAHPPVPPMRRELVATIEEVAAPGPATDIFDVRRLTEFEGVFAHPCCSRAGRIGDAKFLFYEDLIRDGRYKPAFELKALLDGVGLSPDRKVVTYCHRGARAATAYVALKEAGFDDVAIFVGSWHEWAAREDLPLVTGPARK